MAEYKEIHGSKVKNYEYDPDNPHVGQVWYNEELASLRVYDSYLGSGWSTGGSLNTARRISGDAGTQTAALCYGGFLGPPGNTGITENYNGTS